MSDFNPSYSFEKLNYETDDQGIVTITINSPKTLNALTIPIVDELINALTQAELNEKTKVVVLTGAGKGFSSGGDIGYMMSAAGSPHQMRSMARRFATRLGDLSRRIRQIPFPVIAKINGAAAGAGMSLALACDFRIASKNSKFVQAFVNVGLVPDAGGIGLLTKLVGAAKATEWIMLGEQVSAEEAHRLGLLYQLVEPDQLDDSTLQLAKKLASLPTLSLSKIKETINIAAFSDMEAIYTSEVINQSLLSVSDDFHEGVQAFIEKRPPQFKGK